MPTPHDYYDIHGMPRLHNVGEGRPYLENDYHANDHGPQVPSLSTIGRGPRGEGLKVGNVVNENNTVSFALYSDLTGELVWQSPNLDPGTLDFYPADFRDLTAGQPAPMDIVHTRGGVTKTTTAYLPCGERGSLVFLLGGRSVPRVPSDTYQTTAEELMIYGHRVWPNDNKPLPHVNDIVFFRYTDGDETGFAFGTIETVGTRNNEETVPSTPIVYTARVFVPCTGGGTAEPLIVEAEWRKAEKAEASQMELVCQETAGIMYEAFVAGRKVLLHVATSYDDGDIAIKSVAPVAEYSYEAYYEIIDAASASRQDGGIRGETDIDAKYISFVAMLNNGGGFRPVVSKIECSEDDYPIFVPDNSSNVLIVETYFDSVFPTEFASVSPTRSDTTAQALYCEVNAATMYEAFVAGVPVLLRVDPLNDSKYAASSETYIKIISAEHLSSANYRFIGANFILNVSTLIFSELVGADDYPYFLEPTGSSSSDGFVVHMSQENTIVGELDVVKNVYISSADSAYLLSRFDTFNPLAIPPRLYLSLPMLFETSFEEAFIGTPEEAEAATDHVLLSEYREFRFSLDGIAMPEQPNQDLELDISFKNESTNHWHLYNVTISLSNRSVIFDSDDPEQGEPIPITSIQDGNTKNDANPMRAAGGNFSILAFKSDKTAQEIWDAYSNGGHVVFQWGGIGELSIADAVSSISNARAIATTGGGGNTRSTTVSGEDVEYVFQVNVPFVEGQIIAEDRVSSGPFAVSYNGGTIMFIDYVDASQPDDYIYFNMSNK